MKICFKVFPMIFQSSMGLEKSRCDVFSGTTQGCFRPWIFFPHMYKISIPSHFGAQLIKKVFFFFAILPKIVFCNFKVHLILLQTLDHKQINWVRLIFVIGLDHFQIHKSIFIYLFNKGHKEHAKTLFVIMKNVKERDIKWTLSLGLAHWKWIPCFCLCFKFMTMYLTLRRQIVNKHTHRKLQKKLQSNFDYSVLCMFIKGHKK